MADYSAVESVLDSAIPQVFAAKYPDHPFCRTIHVTKDAEDNFVITAKQVLISPKCLDHDLNLMKFCTRIARACWDFDHLAERRAKELHDEFQAKMDRLFEDVVKRWDRDTLVRMIDSSFDHILPEVN